MKYYLKNTFLRPALTAGLGFALAGLATAQTFTNLHSFTGGGGGSFPQAGLTLSGNTLYGTAYQSGISNNGIVFKVNTDGSGFTNLRSFTGGSDGGTPHAGLILSGGTLYGTTLSSGSNGYGTIFAINTNGMNYSTVYTFTDGSKGAYPQAGVILSGNTLYGTAVSGGSGGSGVIFKVNTNGAGYTNFHSFTARTSSILTNSDGAFPQAGLILSGNTLYGTSSAGGSSNNGTVFKVHTDGSGFANLHSFTGSDGSSPYAGLVLLGNTLYGTTLFGGSNGFGAIFAITTNGTGFTNIYTFNDGSDGASPWAGLTLSGHTLYGTASVGGSSVSGTVFQLNTDGTGFTNLHSFTDRSGSSQTNEDGAYPLTGLVLANDTLYGTASAGGSSNGGTIYRISFGPLSGPLAVTTTSLPGGSKGMTYSNSLSASGGQAPYTWRTNSGALPPGIILATNGVIFGKPTTIGTFTFTVMVTDALSATATQALVLKVNLADIAKPTLTIAAPKANHSVSNVAFTASGSAKDNVAVQSVSYQLNGAAWQLAATANNWSNWTAAVTLIPGTNRFSAYAMDTDGNLSTTQTVSFVYVLTAILAVHTNGNGTVNPNYNGQLLEIGKSYSITAKAAKGFGFTAWSGSLATTNSRLSFVMASNLTFTANFVDNTRPILAIAAPKANHSVSNAAAYPMYMASGTARDNVAVANVFFQFNGGSWNTAQTLNSFSNWTANLNLSAGTNKLNAYAADAAGNLSITSSVSFVFVVLPDWAPASVLDLTAEVTPDSGFGAPFAVSFSGDTFSKSGVGTNSGDYGVGEYGYIKTGTNTAQLFRTNTAPPTVSNDVASVDLVFTNANSGTFSNTIAGDTGTIKFSAARMLAPASVGGRILIADKTGGNLTVVLHVDNTFVSSTTAGTNSGTYAFANFSPVGALMRFNFTDTAMAGDIDYVQLTFTATTGGKYFFTSYDNLGDPAQTGTNIFTLK